MEELQKDYDNLLEDYNYILNLLKEKNEEIVKLEIIIDELLNKELKNNERRKK